MRLVLALAIAVGAGASWQASAQELTRSQEASFDALFADARKVEDRAQRVFNEWINTNFDVVSESLVRSKCAEYGLRFAQLAKPIDAAALESAELARKAAKAAVSELDSQLYKKVWGDLRLEPIPFTVRVAASVDTAFRSYRNGFSVGDPTNWFSSPDAYSAECRKR
jgi:hypothetical protein